MDRASAFARRLDELPATRAARKAKLLIVRARSAESAWCLNVNSKSASELSELTIERYVVFSRLRLRDALYELVLQSRAAVERAADCELRMFRPAMIAPCAGLLELRRNVTHRREYGMSRYRGTHFAGSSRDATQMRS